MRLRHAAGAAFGALALIATIPTSANAASGIFYYQYGDSSNPTAGKLEDPKADQCHDIPEVEGKPGSAFSPQNNVTEHEVTLYSEEDCAGVGTKLAYGSELGPDVKFKSVIFELED
ncbi:hypothetical protein RB200_30540 [Streptomyces sp. PmtG]